MKRLVMGTLAAALLLAATPLCAHEDFHVEGVITKRYTNNKQEMMEVTFDRTSLVTLWISKLTKVTQGGKPLTTDALKQGVSVIVDSYGDEFDYSEALKVQIAAPGK